MKNIKLILITIVLFSAFYPAFSQDDKSLIVLVKYKVQPGKDGLAISGLKSLIDKVKAEPNYVKIILHSDPADSTNILLYEQWSDADYYKGDHMKTAHLQQFMNDSRMFLTGPPEITFWKID